MKYTWPLARLSRNAAQWFVTLRAGPITPRVDAKFRRWLAADPAHEVDFERQELAWELAAELANDGEINALVEDAQAAAARRRPPTRPFFLSWSAVAVALAALAIGIVLFAQRPVGGETYIAGIGEQRTIVLPDQSRMILNTDTKVRVVFKRHVREIEIDHGEATFSVTHDPQRPFEVHAGGGLARALGTQFNVLAAAQGATVAVLSGKVAVSIAAVTERSTGAQSAILMQGQEASYDAAGVSPVHAAKAARIYAWHSGRIAFEDVDLEHALIEVNRYTRTPVVLEDPSLGTVRVSGVFRIGETDALLQALETAFGIRAERSGASIKLRRGA
jgi:transmembrane sensor